MRFEPLTAGAISLLAACSSFDRYDAAALERDIGLDMAIERDVGNGLDVVDAADVSDVRAVVDAVDVTGSDGGADAIADGPPATCGAPLCSSAATAPCDLADGFLHELMIGPAPDAFPFECATFTPGAAAVRLTLAVARNAYLDLTTPAGSTAAIQVYRAAACGAPAIFVNSCIATTGTVRDDLGVVQPGTYFVVVKSNARPTVLLRASLM